MKRLFLMLSIIAFVIATPVSAFAQTTTQTVALTATSSAVVNEATKVVQKTINQTQQNINEFTNPEQDKQKNAILTALKQQRQVSTVSLINFIPYAIQYAIQAGVPTNTIVII